jgi:hypothetical protein
MNPQMNPSTKPVTTTATLPSSTLTRSLPPLILHPFAQAGGRDRLEESQRASLMMQGLLPSGERSEDDLDRTLLDGRFSEILMLFYVGKDLSRWIEQCLEHIARQPDLRESGIRYQSFAEVLVNHAPPTVQAKLRRWGVADYRSIFMRALAMNTLLAAAPERHLLSDEFVRNYYRYADQLFTSRQNQVTFTAIEEMGFEFEIFASGEYSKMLEREWAEG